LPAILNPELLIALITTILSFQRSLVLPGSPQFERSFLSWEIWGNLHSEDWSCLINLSLGIVFIFRPNIIIHFRSCYHYDFS